MYNKYKSRLKNKYRTCIQTKRTVGNLRTFCIRGQKYSVNLTKVNGA